MNAVLLQRKQCSWRFSSGPRRGFPLALKQRPSSNDDVPVETSEQILVTLKESLFLPHQRLGILADKYFPLMWTSKFLRQGADASLRGHTLKSTYQQSGLRRLQTKRSPYELPVLSKDSPHSRYFFAEQCGALHCSSIQPHSKACRYHMGQRGSSRLVRTIFRHIHESVTLYWLEKW